jgi:class I fructose-bisphosphate aldolase
VAAELGADIAKVPYTGSVDTFAKVVEGCPIPVVIAGGSKVSDEQTLEMIKGAMDAGAAGISMGRNVFQHENPELLVKAASAIVHGGATVEDAMAVISGSG